MKTNKARIQVIVAEAAAEVLAKPFSRGGGMFHEEIRDFIDERMRAAGLKPLSGLARTHIVYTVSHECVTQTEEFYPVHMFGDIGYKKKQEQYGAYSVNRQNSYLTRINPCSDPEEITDAILRNSAKTMNRSANKGRPVLKTHQLEMVVELIEKGKAPQILIEQAVRYHGKVLEEMGKLQLFLKTAPTAESLLVANREVEYIHEDED